MSVADVGIHGNGVAACCCAHLLQRAGLTVGWGETRRRPLPALLLGNAAQALIRDIFGKKDLFRDGHRISSRVVAWGGRDAVTLDHSAVVVSEQQLLERLRPAGLLNDVNAGWTIFASSPADTTEHAFGTRIATALPVELSGGAETCAIESLTTGWLFLLPCSAASGWLLGIGGAPEDLLAQSSVVSKRIAHAGAAVGSFAAYPRISMPLAAPGWLACGGAAMSFDPICGDGAGNAVREAILASAVVRAALNGEQSDPLLSHYQDRLKLGFRRHLELCLSFYRSGGRTPWWEREEAALLRGIEWCGNEPRFRYQLSGFDLRAIPV